MIDERERSEVIVDGISDSFYQRPEEDDRCYTDPATLNHLMQCEVILETMMKMGVHEWQDFDAVMDAAKKTWKGM